MRLFEGRDREKQFIKSLFEKKDEKVIESLVRMNHRLAEMIAFLTGVIELGFLIWSGFQYGCATDMDPSLPQYQSQILYAFMMVLSFAMYIYLMIYRESFVKFIKVHSVIIEAYFFILLLWSIYLSTIYARYGERAYVFILSLICTFGVMILKPVRLLRTTVFSYLIYMLIFWECGVFRWSHALNILEILFYLSMINIMRYYLICDHFENNRKLEAYSSLLEHLSFKDELTNLKNRNALRKDWLGFLGNTYSVIIIDIDDFKKYNDTYGHLTGDFVIKSVAEKMMEIFGEEEVFRMGGDEFMIITHVLDPEIKTLIESLQRKVKSIKTDETNLGVTLSIGGVKGTCVKVDDMRTFMAKADEVLYEVKEQGKNSFLYKS